MILSEYGKEIEPLDTFAKDEKLFYRFKVLRNSRLRSSILQEQISEIGKIKEFEREVSLNADRKRLWMNKILTLNTKTLNESIPISLNHFQKVNI